MVIPKFICDCGNVSEIDALNCAKCGKTFPKHDMLFCPDCGRTRQINILKEPDTSIAKPKHDRFCECGHEFDGALFDSAKE